MRRAILAAVLWSLPCAALHGGDFSSSAVGTTGASFLRIGAGARAVAMGGAFSAVADDASAIYWNPAGLARLRGKSLQLSHLGDQDGVSLQHIAFGAKAGRLAWGGALAHMDAGGIERTDVAGNSQGTYRPRDYAATLSLAADLDFLPLPEGSLAVGVSGKVFKSKIVEEANGHAIDLGLLGRRELGDDWTAQVAAVAQNLGVSVKYDQDETSLPTAFQMGLALLSQRHWTLSVQGSMPKGNGPQGGLGMEYRGEPAKGIKGALRIGADSLTRSGVSPLGALSLGAGLSFGMLSVDYAATMMGDATQTHRLTLGFRFGLEATARSASGWRSTSGESQWESSARYWRD